MALQSNQIDLKTDGGARTVTVTPGNSATFKINSTQARIGAGGGGGAGLWNYVRRINLQFFLTLVRSSGGTTPIWAEQFPRCIKSINLNTPMHGTLVDPAFVNGMVAKNIMEWISNGYRHIGINRQPIAGSDATYTRAFEISLCFSQYWNDWPDHFAWWLGWLNDGELEITVESAAQPFGISGVTITSVVCKAHLETVPMSEVIIPPYVLLRKYEATAAASSSGPILTGVGNPGSLQGAEDASRLIASLYSHQSGGFVGSGTADQISTIALAWRDQAVTQFPDAFFLRWLADTREQRMGFNTSGGSATDGFDLTLPYLSASAPASAAVVNNLNDPAAFYTPLVWPNKGQLITQFQKVKGIYPYDITYSAAQSNVFRIYNEELKYFGQAKVAEMLASMSIDPGAVDLVPKLGRKNFKPISVDKLWGLPRNIITKKAA
jgi:hypothetical protein